MLMGLLIHFFFRFVDEFMPAFIHFRQVRCNRSLLSLFYSLSFSLRIFFVRDSLLVVFVLCFFFSGFASAWATVMSSILPFFECSRYAIC